MVNELESALIRVCKNKSGIQAGAVL
jgi:hypothetical protein